MMGSYLLKLSKKTPSNWLAMHQASTVSSSKDWARYTGLYDS